MVTCQMNDVHPYFRVRRDEPVKQLMIRWCALADVRAYKTIRFYDPERIMVDENKIVDKSGGTGW